MSNRLPLLATMVVLAFVSWPLLPSDAAQPLLEHEDICGEYRVIGDRVLLKNPNASVELVHLMYRTQDGLGTTWWDDDVRLTYADSSDAHWPRVAVRNAYLHTSWVDDRINMLYKVFYKRSTDLGHTWEEDVLISDAPEEVEQSSPDITVSTSCLHAVWGYSWKPIWEQGHIYYRRSLDNGETWEDLFYLSSYEMQSKPSIAALGDTVYVIFKRSLENPDRTETRFRKSYDEGAAWREDKVIADYGAQLIRGTLRANEEGLHYVFQHEDNFDDPSNPYCSEEIFYIHSSDFGDTWTDPIIVSHRDSIHSQWPSMCVDDEGTIHVTWFDYKYSPYSWTGDIFYTKSTDKSTDNDRFWSQIEVLSDAHLARSSYITAGGDHLCLVWEDERNGSHNNEIYFRHSRDRGECWDQERRLTNASKESVEPAIAEQNDSLYAVWADCRDDPTNRAEEIYFKRGGVEAVSVERFAFPRRELYLNSHPNPFNEKVVIRYRLPGSLGARSASLKIYNIRGQLVTVLLDGELIPGEYETLWDGTGSRETKVSSGVYLCVLQVGKSRSVAPLLFLK